MVHRWPYLRGDVTYILPEANYLSHLESEIIIFLSDLRLSHICTRAKLPINPLIKEPWGSLTGVARNLEHFLLTLTRFQEIKKKLGHFFHFKISELDNDPELRYLDGDSEPHASRKLVFSEKNIRFINVLGLIEGLKQIKLQRKLLACVLISDLLFNMFSDRNVKSFLVFR